MSSESVVNNFKDLHSFIESPQGKVLISKKLSSRYYKIIISNEKFCVIQKENEKGFFSFISPVEEDIFLLFEIDENGMIKVLEIYDEKKLFKEIEKIIISNDFILESLKFCFGSVYFCKSVITILKFLLSKISLLES